MTLGLAVFLKGNEIISNIYSIVYLDYIVVNVRQNKHIMNMAVYLTLGVELDGKKGFRCY
ncbi:transposase [Psychrobacter sp. SIMBA_152]